MLLLACTNKEQEAYQENLTQANEKIESNEFEDAQNFLIEAIATGYKENQEAKQLLKQLELYKTLSDLLDDGKFDEIYQAIDVILQVEGGSTTLNDKADEFKTTTEQDEQQFNAFKKTVNDALKLTEEKKYTQANEQLKQLDLTDYEANYFASLKNQVSETIQANEVKIKAIQAEAAQKKAAAEEKKAESARQKEKAEAEKQAQMEQKKKEQAEHKKNKLNWSDKEISQFMASFFNKKAEHLDVQVFRDVDSGYSIEVRLDDETKGEENPDIDPVLGFFEVLEDGNLYQIEIDTGELVLVDK